MIIIIKRCKNGLCIGGTEGMTPRKLRDSRSQILSAYVNEASNPSFK